MKVIYVAGPFRGINAWHVELNIRRAEEVGFMVAECGAMPLIPHTNTRFFDGTLTGEFWLAGTMELLKRCDGIVMVGGWSESEGSKGELAWAVENDLPVFYADAIVDAPGCLRVWLEKMG